MAYRPIDRRDVPHHAQGCVRGRGLPGSDRSGRQHAVPDRVRPQERQGTLEL